MVKNPSGKYRLDDNEAEIIVGKLNKSREYRLTSEQEENLLRLRGETEETITKVNDYKPKHSHFTAVGIDGQLMNINEYCSHYGLDYSKVRSFKLVTHTAVPFYNIAFYETVLDTSLSEEDLKKIIKEGLEDIQHKPKIKDGRKTGVVKIADLHFGAYVDNLIRTGEFSIDILAKDLRRAAEEINARNYKRVHVHILGDLIESFTGLNHKNSWKGLDKGMVGSEAIKLCCKVLHKDFLSQIGNLGEIKIVAGNHDRVTSDNNEDVKGEAADLISWGLQLMGYDVEFNALVIKHVVDNICHILTHGHHGISKKSTKQLCWDYGVQGMFNLITEGHLHSTIEKLSISQRDKFQIVKDDSVDHRRMNCPSFFTGNFYSESLGFASPKGFLITEDNGNGIPHVFNYSL